jgi:hypothetical protein
VEDGIRQPSGRRGAVYLGQPGDEFLGLDSAARLAAVLADRAPATQSLHPVAVHPQYLTGQPGSGVRSVTPYRAISIAAIVVSEMMPAFAAP